MLIEIRKEPFNGYKEIEHYENNLGITGKFGATASFIGSMRDFNDGREIEKMFGGGRNVSFNRNGSFNFNGMAFGGGDGITNSRTAGANFANDFDKGTDLSADYFYSSANTFNEELRNRENILPENRYFSNAFSLLTARYPTFLQPEHYWTLTKLTLKPEIPSWTVCFENS